uniref:Uncharacterized protein n=1 Tax=Heterorhabditis bacteriophora TaxID=37862 RepID=A0A1I7XC25_HETBA
MANSVSAAAENVRLRTGGRESHSGGGAIAGYCHITLLCWSIGNSSKKNAKKAGPKLAHCSKPMYDEHAAAMDNKLDCRIQGNRKCRNSVHKTFANN